MTHRAPNGEVEHPELCGCFNESNPIVACNRAFPNPESTGQTKILNSIVADRRCFVSYSMNRPRQLHRRVSIGIRRGTRRAIAEWRRIRF